MDELVRKRGRPLKVGSKRHSKIIRLTDEQLDILEHVSRVTGKTFTDILVDGLFDQYDKCADLDYGYFDDYYEDDFE